jgi:rod shape-determining protein MreC
LRNFILFVRRFFNLILFLAIEIVCIVLIARTNSMQGNDVMSSANTMIGMLYQKQNDVVYYFGLKRMNDSLLNENMRLRLELASRYSSDTFTDLVIRKPFETEDSIKKIIDYSKYLYHAARVVNNSVSSSNNYITINRGSNDGIQKNMAVITGSGVVGRIVHVSGNFSSALSVLSVKQPVSARLKDGTIGYVSWEGKQPDELIMQDVPQQIKVNKGDSVFTTRYSFFPPDVLIGTVFKREYIKKNNLQILHLRTATNFRNLQYVYVVENTYLPERRQLEDSVKNK